MVECMKRTEAQDYPQQQPICSEIPDIGNQPAKPSPREALLRRILRVGFWLYTQIRIAD